MNNLVKLKPKHKKIVDDILKLYPYKFYVFGSRVHSTPREFSDLDLCFLDDIKLTDLSDLVERFDNSLLPYKVDIINLNQCDENFKNKIMNQMIPW
jgi:predicted nucleotidyltransferase